MEQYIYLFGVLLSGLVVGLSGYAAKGDTVEKRKAKMKKSYHPPAGHLGHETVAASLVTLQVATNTQSSMWSRIELLEKKQDGQEVEMAQLRQELQKKNEQVEEQQKEINTLKRKVERLREKLKEQGIEISDEELEEML